jgi:hypothetical protein
MVRAIRGNGGWGPLGTVGVARRSSRGKLVKGVKSRSGVQRVPDRRLESSCPTIRPFTGDFLSPLRQK